LASPHPSAATDMATVNKTNMLIALEPLAFRIYPSSSIFE